MRRISRNGKIGISFFLLVFCPALMLSAVAPRPVHGQKEPDPYYTLGRTVEDAVSAALELKSAREETMASSARKMNRRSEFFPIFNLTYQYTRNDDEQAASGIGTINPRNEYALSASLTQPLFTGFDNLNRYRIAELNLEADGIVERIVRQNIVLEAKNVYFVLLKALKLNAVALETVAQIEAQRKVADDFYKVGMTPLNDLLQVEVELANAKQQEIITKNEVETAEAAFNTLLRRPVNAPVVLEDVTDWEAFEYDIEFCLSEAEKKRSEIEVAEIDMEIAEKELNVAKKDYFPSVDLAWSYRQQGVEWDARGGLGTFGDGSTWDITAVATWDLFEFGRTYYGAQEQVHRVAQARLDRDKLLDDIRLQVKRAYLKMRESEKNIKTVELAIEQARENYRIFTERYKEQAATQTDVLIAQTLLSRTMTNYYNALYDYKRAKAALYRAMGHEGPLEKTNR